MPKLQNAKLVLTDRGEMVDVNITYTITYAPLERLLMDNGVVFKEGILLLANDTQMYSLRYLPPPITPDGSILSEPVYRDLTPPANGGLTQNEAQRFSVTRKSLNEDPPIYDVGAWGGYWGSKYHVSVWQTPQDDEIHARIYVVSHGIQLATATADTNEWVLAGPEQAGLVYSSTP